MCAVSASSAGPARRGPVAGTRLVPARDAGPAARRGGGHRSRRPRKVDSGGAAEAAPPNRPGLSLPGPMPLPWGTARSAAPPGHGNRHRPAGGGGCGPRGTAAPFAGLPGTRRSRLHGRRGRGSAGGSRPAPRAASPKGSAQGREGAQGSRSVGFRVGTAPCCPRASLRALPVSVLSPSLSSCCPLRAVPEPLPVLSPTPPSAPPPPPWGWREVVSTPAHPWSLPELGDPGTRFPCRS